MSQQTVETVAPPQARYRIPTLRQALLSPRAYTGLFAVSWLGIAVAVGASWFSVKYSWLIYQRLREGPFATYSSVYAAPRTIRTGDVWTPEELIAQVQRRGYNQRPDNPAGQYIALGNSVEVRPGSQSYFRQEPVRVTFNGNRVSRIQSLLDNRVHGSFQIEPELISNLDENRERRRHVNFSDMPPVLVQAVTSAEDKRFFQHTGFDVLRILRAAYIDVRELRKEQGASTLSMQLARNLFLDQQKTWGRKLAEAFLTLHLEMRHSKEEIFEHYANQIYMGRRGSFSIHGFGEAARAYLGKDVRQLTLPEAATVAGIIQRPSYFNPFRSPERVKARRNVVLGLMLQNGYITPAQHDAAVKAPLVLATPASESTDAPYFVDLVNQELQSRFEDHDFHARSYRIYTTLDMDLQRDAALAAIAGMREVDAQLARRRLRKGEQRQQAQMALVALDARTGEIKALIGGRDYGASQLNRALARRQPGSAFKPFVYAAALAGPLRKNGPFVTPATVLADEPVEFTYQGQVYRPRNFHDEYFGQVTVRRALAKSLNVPTVHLADMAGYGEVARLAKAAGMNAGLQPTPALALGAYDVTPLELAGAYTIFSRLGSAAPPRWIAGIRDGENQVVYEQKATEEPVLDPRVAYLVTNLMEDVLRSGTGAAVRARGVTVPAAGKTGTSRDGWFAGFTSELICVVWVGFDDGKELGLEGAKSALPIWAEFMRRAHQRRPYRDARPFDVPAGIARADICADSGALPTAACFNVRSEVFLKGAVPTEECPVHTSLVPPLEPPQQNRSLWDKLRGIFR
jgi:penicillin-binding protein 1B